MKRRWMCHLETISFRIFPRGFPVSSIRGSSIIPGQYIIILESSFTTETRGGLKNQ